MRTVLAADMGGTSTRLALYDLAAAAAWVRDPRSPPVPRRQQVFASAAFGSLEALCRQFAGPQDQISAAALGVAGPVVDGRCVATNLPWIVEPAALSAVLGCAQVALYNDLEALAVGTTVLPEGALVTLQQGQARRGHIAVLAAGTGLGQAQLFWDGHAHHPGATEGGHVEFAPEDADDEALLRFVRSHLVAAGAGPHVSWERVVSGAGLGLIATFLACERGALAAPSVAAAMARGQSLGAAVGEAAIRGDCAASLAAARWWVRLLGRQAGNWALSLLALGGVRIGGGIPAKLLPLLGEPAFLDAFAAKGRYRELMHGLPVAVVTDPLAGLYGALALACRYNLDISTQPGRPL